MAKSGQEHQVCFNFSQSGIDQLAEPFPIAFLDVQQCHRIARIGKHMGDAPAHAPGAGSQDTFIRHQIPSCSNSARASRSKPARPRFPRVRPVSRKSRPVIAEPRASRPRDTGVSSPW